MDASCGLVDEPKLNESVFFAYAGDCRLRGDTTSSARKRCGGRLLIAVAGRPVERWSTSRPGLLRETIKRLLADTGLRQGSRDVAVFASKQPGIGVAVERVKILASQP